MCKRCGRREVETGVWLSVLFYFRRLRLAGLDLGCMGLPLGLLEDLGELEEALETKRFEAQLTAGIF